MSSTLRFLSLALLLGCSSSTTSDIVVLDAPPGAGPDSGLAGPDGGAASTADAGTCGTSLSSCLTVKCCDGLVCCSGTPIPPGQAFCYPSMCPY